MMLVLTGGTFWSTSAWSFEFRPEKIVVVGTTFSVAVKVTVTVVVGDTMSRG
jgi:hypothetical protein